MPQVCVCARAAGGARARKAAAAATYRAGCCDHPSPGTNLAESLRVISSDEGGKRKDLGEGGEGGTLSRG